MYRARTKDLGKMVTSVCEVGCIGCKMCVKACPADAVTYENNLIKIDHKACIAYGSSCEEACVEKCPRDIFRIYDGRQFLSRVLKKAVLKWPAEKSVSGIQTRRASKRHMPILEESEAGFTQYEELYEDSTKNQTNMR